MKKRAYKRLPRNQEIWEKAIEAAGQKYPPGNEEGVFAYTVAPKRVAGINKNYYALRLYISQKHPNPRKAIEPVEVILNDGSKFCISPDIVATGRGPKALLSVHRHIDYTGLHSGAIITTSQVRGGVACLLTEDNYSPTHLLTAGHLFPEGNEGDPVYAASGSTNSPVEAGNLVCNLLDTNSNSGFPIDAALVSLTAQGQDMVNENWGVTLDGIMSPDQLLNRSAMIFSSNSQDLTLVHTGLSFASGWFTSDVRSHNYQVHNVIQVLPGTATDEGDSGTILFSGQTGSNLAMGLCVGGGLSFFEPIERALNAFNNNGYSSLNLWGF